MTGNLVRDLRRRLGLTQSGMADLLGVERTALARWEKRGAARIRMRARSEEILIIVADFPSDSTREIQRLVRAGRSLAALALVLQCGGEAVVASV